MFQAAHARFFPRHFLFTVFAVSSVKVHGTLPKRKKISRPISQSTAAAGKDTTARPVKYRKDFPGR
jgi:hypothetical protein